MKKKAKFNLLKLFLLNLFLLILITNVVNADLEIVSISAEPTDVTDSTFKVKIIAEIRSGTPVNAEHVTINGARAETCEPIDGNTACSRTLSQPRTFSQGGEITANIAV